jgi:hypothetical protein
LSATGFTGSDDSGGTVLVWLPLPEKKTGLKELQRDFIHHVPLLIL